MTMEGVWMLAVARIVDSTPNVILTPSLALVRKALLETLIICACLLMPLLLVCPNVDQTVIVNMELQTNVFAMLIMLEIHILAARAHRILSHPAQL